MTAFEWSFWSTIALFGLVLLFGDSWRIKKIEPTRSELDIFKRPRAVRAQTLNEQILSLRDQLIAAPSAHDAQRIANEINRLTRKRLDEEMDMLRGISKMQEAFGALGSSLVSDTVPPPVRAGYIPPPVPPKRPKVPACTYCDSPLSGDRCRSCGAPRRSV